MLKDFRAFAMRENILDIAATRCPNCTSQLKAE
jgi:Fe-S oxidoreductase